MSRSETKVIRWPGPGRSKSSEARKVVRKAATDVGLDRRIPTFVLVACLLSLACRRKDVDVMPREDPSWKPAPSPTSPSSTLVDAAGSTSPSVSPSVSPTSGLAAHEAVVRIDAMGDVTVDFDLSTPLSDVDLARWVRRRIAAGVTRFNVQLSCGVPAANANHLLAEMTKLADAKRLQPNYPCCL